MYDTNLPRRSTLRTVAGVLAFGAGVGAINGASAAHETNYAEIEFDDQRTGGATVIVDRLLIEADGFITIHHWDLIAEQNGPDTIIGVSRPLEPGEYTNVPVRLFNSHFGFSPQYAGRKRLHEDQTLIAVPHRDIEHTGEFDFTSRPHVDIPFTNGAQAREDLPVDGAVNDVAHVEVASDEAASLDRSVGVSGR